MIVCFAGPMGSGKTTLAEYLVKHKQFHSEALAQPIKDMMAVFGLTKEEIAGSLKEIPCAKLCGKTPRHAMQTLGTEWGRGYIGQGVWLERWLRRANLALSAGLSVVCDDLRFPNEALTMRRAHALIIFVDRPQELRGRSSNHVSELGGMRDHAHVVLDNSSELSTSYALLNEIIEDRKITR